MATESVDDDQNRHESGVEHRVNTQNEGGGFAAVVLKDLETIFV
jgi:hypothetical protein